MNNPSPWIGLGVVIAYWLTSLVLLLTCEKWLSKHYGIEECLKGVILAGLIFAGGLIFVVALFGAAFLLASPIFLIEYLFRG